MIYLVSGLKWAGKNYGRQVLFLFVAKMVWWTPGGHGARNLPPHETGHPSQAGHPVKEPDSSPPMILDTQSKELDTRHKEPDTFPSQEAGQPAQGAGDPAQRSRHTAQGAEILPLQEAGHPAQGARNLPQQEAKHLAQGTKQKTPTWWRSIWTQPPKRILEL